MNRVGKIAAILSIAAGGAFAASGSSPALADPPPLIDDLNLGVSPALLPNLSTPPLLCFPRATNSNVIKGDRNQTVTIQNVDCAQRADQTSPPPSNGGGLRNREVVVSDDFTVPQEDISDSLVQQCPNGKVVLGGGYYLHTWRYEPGIHDIFFKRSSPNDDGTGWVVEVVNATPGDIVLKVWAVCADPA